MRLTLPYPPSGNRYWRVFRGIVVPSQEAKTYKASVKFRAMNQDVFEPLKGEVVVSVAVFRPQRSGDLDNRLKVLLDSLRGVAFADDKQVVELHARRYDDASNPRVEVTVEPDSVRKA